MPSSLSALATFGAMQCSIVCAEAFMPDVSAYLLQYTLASDSLRLPVCQYP